MLNCYDTQPQINRTNVLEIAFLRLAEPLCTVTVVEDKEANSEILSKSPKCELSLCKTVK